MLTAMQGRQVRLERASVAAACRENILQVLRPKAVPIVSAAATAVLWKPLLVTSVMKGITLVKAAVAVVCAQAESTATRVLRLFDIRASIVWQASGAEVARVSVQLAQAGNTAELQLMCA